MLINITINACQKNSLYQIGTTIPTYNGSIYAYLQNNAESFDSVLYALDRSGFADSLKNGTYTFFAPTNQSLSSALSAFNLTRKNKGLPAISLHEIDATSWKIIMGRYIVRGKWQLNDFHGQDGEQLTTVVKRFMNGSISPIIASGASGVGGSAITYSYDNGSRFNKDWLTAKVTTADIQTSNGIIHILETSHLVGFNYFSEKADTIQNVYSENRTYASGVANLPNLMVQNWSLRIKKMTAAGVNNVDVEAANRLDSGYVMRLTVLPSDSVLITSAPNSTIQSIERNGPCYFDESSFTFNLNYRYASPTGIVTVTETIKYIAQ